MSETSLIAFPDQGERTLAAFFAAMASEIGATHHEILNELARALTERGWVQAVEHVVAKLGEMSSEDAVRTALGELEARRLVYVDREAGKFTGLLGCLSVTRTEHRGHLSSGIDVFTYGGMDLLTLNATLLKSVDLFTRCPVTGQDIRLKVEDGQIVESNAHGFAGFLASWDGQAPLAEVSRRSPLFANDEAMEAWVKAHPEVPGTEIPGDLMLWVGMSQATDLGNARFRLIGHE
ncbi:MAG: hypothetical protein KC635_08185 [Myxococcales bacterium]|nr:hypothetical protein [Myxococcales bacterium]MCB9731563.1 hypothetical protein [Deltaproteobacteria bacterium]